MTIHELANFTGSSIRALHYYDKIGLLKPHHTEKNGYRVYNEDSLLKLQQIMFYKEMDLPLKTIKNIMNQPDFDRKEAIKEQKELLLAKKNRLTRMIEQMDQILEGDDTLDFSIFEHNELEEVLTSRMMKLDKEYQQSLIDEYGSVEDFIKSMMKNESTIRESAIEHFGSVKKYLETLNQEPIPKSEIVKLQTKLDGIIKQIVSYKENDDVSLLEIQKLVAEWKITFQEICQMEDITELFQKLYHGYMENAEVIKAMDNIYGEGSTVFIGKAMDYYDSKH